MSHSSVKLRPNFRFGDTDALRLDGVDSWDLFLWGYIPLWWFELQAVIRILRVTRNQDQRSPFPMLAWCLRRMWQSLRRHRCPPLLARVAKQINTGPCRRIVQESTTQQTVAWRVPISIMQIAFGNPLAIHCISSTFLWSEKKYPSLTAWQNEMPLACA